MRTNNNEQTNVAGNIVDMVSALSRRQDHGTLGSAIAAASNREIWLWWNEAVAHELTASAMWERKLASAVAHQMSAEAVRRIGTLPGEPLEPMAIAQPPQLLGL